MLRLAYVHSALQSGGLQYSGKEPSGEGPEGQNRTGGTPVQAHFLICSTQPRGAASTQLGALWRDRAAAENVRVGEGMKARVNNYILL